MKDDGFDINFGYLTAKSDDDVYNRPKGILLFLTDYDLEESAGMSEALSLFTPGIAADVHLKKGFRGCVPHFTRYQHSLSLS